MFILDVRRWNWSLKRLCVFPSSNQFVFKNVRSAPLGLCSFVCVSVRHRLSLFHSQVWQPAMLREGCVTGEVLFQILWAPASVQPRHKRMTFLRRLLRRRLHPWKLAIVAFVFLTFLFLMQREVVSHNPQDEPWLRDIVGKRDAVIGMVMGAVNNFRDAMPKMQIKAPVRQQQQGNEDGVACLPGYYTAAELRPVLERPPQNPSHPGASGKAFHTDDLSPGEQKEKQRGEEKHCFNLYASDRISLSRDLGPDTRPPEYVPRLCFAHLMWTFVTSTNITMFVLKFIAAFICMRGWSQISLKALRRCQEPLL